MAVSDAARLSTAWSKYSPERAQCAAMSNINRENNNNNNNDDDDDDDDHNNKTNNNNLLIEEQWLPMTHKPAAEERLVRRACLPSVLSRKQ